MAIDDIEILDGPNENLASDNVIAYADITKQEKKAGAEVNPLDITLLDVSELVKLLHEVDREWRSGVERNEFDIPKFNKIAKQLIKFLLDYAVTTEEFRKELRPYTRVKNNISRLMLKQVYGGESRVSSARNEILSLKEQTQDISRWLNKYFGIHTIDEIDPYIKQIHATLPEKDKARASALKNATDLAEKRDQLIKIKEQLDFEAKQLSVASEDFDDADYANVLADYETKLKEAFDVLSEKAKAIVRRTDPAPTPLSQAEIRRLQEYGQVISRLESQLDAARTLDKPGTEHAIAGGEDTLRKLRQGQNRILGPHIRAATPKPYKAIVVKTSYLNRILERIALLVSFMNQEDREEVDAKFGELTKEQVDEEGMERSGRSLSSFISSSRNYDPWGTSIGLGPNRRYLSGMQSYQAEQYEKNAGFVYQTQIMQNKVRQMIADLRDKVYGVGRWTVPYAQAHGMTIEDALKSTGKFESGDKVFYPNEVDDRQMNVIAGKSFDKRKDLINQRKETAESIIRASGVLGRGESIEPDQVEYLLEKARTKSKNDEAYKSYMGKRRSAIVRAKKEDGLEIDKLMERKEELKSEMKRAREEFALLMLEADPTVSGSSGTDFDKLLNQKRMEMDTIKGKRQDVKDSIESIYEKYLTDLTVDEENRRNQFDNFKSEMNKIGRIDTDLNGASTKFPRLIAQRKEEIEGLFTGNLPGRMMISGLPGGVKTITPGASRVFPASKFANVSGINNIQVKFLTKQEQEEQIMEAGKRIGYYTLKDIIAAIIQKAMGLSPVRSQGTVQGPGIGYTGPKGRVQTTAGRKRLPGQTLQTQERIAKRAAELRAKRLGGSKSSKNPEDISGDAPLELEHFIRRGDLVVLENIADAPYLNGLRGHVRKVYNKKKSAVVDLFRNNVVVDETIVINLGEARYYIRG